MKLRGHFWYNESKIQTPIPILFLPSVDDILISICISYSSPLTLVLEPYNLILFYLAPMASSSSSLVLPSLSLPKTLAVSKPTALSFFSLPFSCPSLKLHSNSISVSPSSKGFLTVSPRFVRNVAVSSDYDQDEEVLSDEGEQRFSPDLKLFVGNLPFNVDSAILAGLFEQVGNVEMVEVQFFSRRFSFSENSSLNCENFPTNNLWVP